MRGLLAGGALAIALPVTAPAVHPTEAEPAKPAAVAKPAKAGPARKPASSGDDRYFTTGGFYALPDAARQADDGLGVAYSYAGRLSARRYWELRLFADTLETGMPGATDFYQAGAGADLVQHFGKPGGGHPYALVGAGAIGNDVVPDAQDGVSAYVNAGFGWRSAPWKGWGVRHRLEARVLYDTFESGQTDVLFGVALEIPPSRDRAIEKIVEKQVVVEKVVEKEVVREAAVAVAPADRDGDGIADAQDKCPDTVAGARVDPDGCVRKEQVVVLPSIEFEYASHVLTANGKQQLDMVLRFMKDQPEIGLDVWGHTDSQGEDAYNQRLSERRAASVVQHLVSQGIGASRLASKGFGESKPIASNATIATRARNRRVELHIRAPGAGGDR